MKINRMIEMKKKVISTLIPLLFIGATLLGCSSKTSIKFEQGIQILDMIIYEQSKEDFTRGNEISFTYKISENEEMKTVCFYELSDKNSVIHVYDSEASLKESWYYLESSALYYSFKDNNGEITNVMVSDDPVVASDTFADYFSECRKTVRRKIEEVDTPATYRTFLESLKDIDENKYKSKFQTKKNLHLLADVKIYEDTSKKNLLQLTKFEYSDAKLINYSFQEENNPLREYIIDYTKSVSRDSIS